VLDASVTPGEIDEGGTVVVEATFAYQDLGTDSTAFAPSETLGSEPMVSSSQDNPLDVNLDGWIGALDVLCVVSTLNHPDANADERWPGREDVNRDGTVSALDALSVVNAVNSVAPSTMQLAESTGAFVYMIDWGDGTSDAGAVTNIHADGAGTLSGSFGGEHVYADDGSYTVVVTITDTAGGSDTQNFTVAVNNVAPTIDEESLENSSLDDGGVPAGMPVTVQLDFSDPGFDHDVAGEDFDTFENFTDTTINWGDGTEETVPDIIVTETADSSDEMSAGTVYGSHIYEDVGIYTVTVTVRDDDGGERSLTTQVIVSGIDIQGRVLQIVGTQGDDRVHVNRQGNGLLKVHADFLPDGNFKTFEADDVELIYVVLCHGNDRATIAGNVEKPAIADGGPGDDHLNAGAASGVLLGGLGSDVLIGGSGNDVLIGGGGSDRLMGGPGEDILIGDKTVYDSDLDAGQLMADQALLEILDEWNSGEDFQSRQDALAGWLNETTVFDDDVQDLLTGSSGEDWFYLFDDDIVTDSNSQSGKPGKRK